MKSVQAIIRDILKEDSKVASHIAGRVYDLVFPQGYTVPSITLQRISETLDANTLCGTTVLQIDAYSKTHEQAESIAEAVRQTLTNTTKAGNPAILGITPQNTVDFYTVDNRLYRISTDYAVTWRKT